MWGGEGASGADCSGALWHVCRRSGFHFPRITASKMWAVWGGRQKDGWPEGAFSDLVWFTFTAARPFGHVGMVKQGIGQNPNPESRAPVPFYQASSRQRMFTVSEFKPGNRYDKHFVGIKTLE